MDGWADDDDLLLDDTNDGWGNDDGWGDDDVDIDIENGWGDDERELIDPSIPKKERKVKGIVTMCAICFENEVSHVLYPCGHPCLCLDCSSIGLEECPVCRTRNIRPMKFFGTLIEDVEEIKNEIESNEHQSN